MPLRASHLTAIPGIAVHYLIGRGGMGAVYRARRIHDGLPIALKVSRPSDGRSWDYRAMIAHEAHVMCRLDHPRIVRVYDSGRCGELLWIAMELVDRGSLRQLMKARLISPSRAVRIAIEICQALQHAHGRGVVHNDLKPENVLIADDGSVKIVDFGLAKVRDLSYTVARPGHVSGTLRYMAPEQTRHPRDTDHRIDLYALGVILHEMLTGFPPSSSASLPSDYVDVPEAVDAVVVRSLCQNPNERWQSADDLLKALQRGPQSWMPGLPPSIAAMAEAESFASSTWCA